MSRARGSRSPGLIPPLPRRPGGPLGRVVSQVRGELGVVPEALGVHHPIPELLAVTWASLRESVVAPGRLPRPAKEAMAVAVSRANRCPYCMDAHGLMLHAQGRGEVERALRAGDEPADPRLARLTAWAATTGTGVLPEAPPVEPGEVPEAVATVCCFQYINRMATILLEDSPLPTWLRPWRRPALGWLGRFLGWRSRVEPERGRALALVPEAARREPERWDHLAWARGDPVIHATFAAFAETVEAAVAGVLPPEARDTLRRELASWGGGPAPLGRAWLEDSLKPVAGERRPAGRLALLAARAPHRVTAGDLEVFRRKHPTDAELLAILAWGAHEAARILGRRLPVPGTFPDSSQAREPGPCEGRPKRG